MHYVQSFIYYLKLGHFSFRHYMTRFNEFRRGQSMGLVLSGIKTGF